MLTLDIQERPFRNFTTQKIVWTNSLNILAIKKEEPSINQILTSAHFKRNSTFVKLRAVQPGQVEYN